MQLKHRAVLYQRAKEKEQETTNAPHLPAFGEDAWVNDTMPIVAAGTAHIIPPISTVPTVPTVPGRPNSSTEKVTVPPPYVTPVAEHNHVESEQVPLQREKIPVSSPSQPMASTQPRGYCTPGHPLWPVVLNLSERIWQEVYQKREVATIEETSLIEYIRSRAVVILRAEPGLANKIHDLDEAELVLASVVNEVIGFGPLEVLMQDEKVSEIMAIGPRFTCVERDGQMEDVPYRFEDDRHMMRVIENILRRAGRRMKPDWPMIDVRLPDGALVNIVLPPGAVSGPTLTIRTAWKKPLTLNELVRLNTLSQSMADFLRACVQSRLNIVICGDMAVGRTTLLNALAACIPSHERIATIEDVAELQLEQRHLISLVSQLGDAGAASTAGLGSATMRELVLYALRMGSERIILGDCRGDEVGELLRAMSNGYSGSLLNVYAPSPRACLTHLETMSLANGAQPAVKLLRTQIAGALQVIVYLARLQDGSRKVLNILEVQGFDGVSVKLQSIFHFRNAGFDSQSGKVEGDFEASGFSPTFLSRFEALSIRLSHEMFTCPQSSYAQSPQNRA